jgi:hypothetical protein
LKNQSQSQSRDNQNVDQGQHLKVARVYERHSRYLLHNKMRVAVQGEIKGETQHKHASQNEDRVTPHRIVVNPTGANKIFSNVKIDCGEVAVFSVKPEEIAKSAVVNQ